MVILMCMKIAWTKKNHLIMIWTNFQRCQMRHARRTWGNAAAGHVSHWAVWMWKSTCFELAQKYSHKFCQLAGLPFDKKTFYFTLSTGSLACLFGGITIHSAPHLAKTCITDTLCKDWKHVKILAIDEVSFLSDSDMENLDKNCANRPRGMYYTVVSR